jgi:hypothetical protein
MKKELEKKKDHKKPEKGGKKKHEHKKHDCPCGMK